VSRQDPAESDAGPTTGGGSVCRIRIGRAGRARRQQASAFRLRDGHGRTISSREALRRGPIVLFYRGRWCPYCNHEHRAIEAASHDIRSLGASLVAVSQQTPDNSLETQRRNRLSFASLVDAGGSVTHAFGPRMSFGLQYWL